ncbi:MAG TPA: hypothetical protein ENH10_05760 [Bacteroidetes bacterium]|nr:hypothetical protein BMS3Bbin04_01977 [bacterium BMS3Bbin04]HDO65525.1 hypothetical protein [Bacteroidota bacterium]HEX04650.1 hypothetical protein [Bacteroidota bacterium]
MKRALVVMIAMVLLLPAAYSQMHGGGQGSMKMDDNGHNDSSMMCKNMMGSAEMDHGMMDQSMMDHTEMSGMMGSGMMNPMDSLMDMGLSDGQIEQLIEIQSDLVRDTMPIHRKMMATRQELQQLNLAAQPDLSGIEERKSMLAKSESELVKITSDSQQKALTVLNEEQVMALGGSQLPMLMYSSMSCPMMSDGGMMNMMGGEGMDPGMKMDATDTKSSTSGGDHDSHH